jgi:hypothetical protein
VSCEAFGVGSAVWLVDDAQPVSSTRLQTSQIIR